MVLKEVVQLASALLGAVTAALAFLREARFHRRAREAPKGEHFAPRK